MSVTIMLIMIVAVRSACAITEVGQPAPALVAQELNGQQFDLGAERGKVVIVNFWASWCQPCREEMPALDAFYKRYHSDGLEMIGVSADSRHDRSDVEKAAHSLSYPVAMLNDAETNGFGDPDDLPTTWVIGRDGVVRAELAPDKIQVTEKSLDDTVLPLLGKSDAANTHKSPAAAP
ncbi:MAG TPA: TlpA disulfide reductase family protein [Candidatus Binataceae bacterium]|nr:TlpA disulfide reductase family protein [Candidatus Binataceae bacterium]